MENKGKKPKKNQRTVALEYMMNNDFITDEIGHEICGTNRFGSVISDLRKKYNIKTVMVNGVNRFGNPCRYGRYYLIGKKEA